MKIFLKDRAYVYSHELHEDTLDQIKEENTWHQYLDPYQCRKCEYQKERPDNCGACPYDVYQKHLMYTNGRSAKGTRTIGVNIGYLDRLVELTDFRVVDKRQSTPMSAQGCASYRFNDSLLNERQEEAVTVLSNAVREGTNGILQSAPRTGKTVMGVALVMRLKRKTLYIAHQEDLLVGENQLWGTLFGQTQDGAYFTNLSEMVDHDHPPKVKYCRTLEDFQEADIALTTFQIFLRPKGRKLLESIKDLFGLLLIDEVHKTGATQYNQVINSFNCPRIGMTATPVRKDGRHRLMHAAVGPILHRTGLKSLVPTVSIIPTPYRGRTYKMFHYMLKGLENHTKRHDLIIRFLAKDVAAGRHILVPVVHLSQIEKIVKDLKKLGIAAEGWHGRLSRSKKNNVRAQILQKAISGEIKVLVAQRSLLTGVNVQRWDTLYEIVPMNNAPNFEQEYRRICTPAPESMNKQTPVIRFFLDGDKIARRCTMNTLHTARNQGAKFTKSAASHLEELEDSFNKSYRPSGFALGKVANELADDEESIVLESSTPKRKKEPERSLLERGI